MSIFDTISDQLKTELPILETKRKKGWNELYYSGDKEAQRLAENNFNVPDREETEAHENIKKLRDISDGANYYGLWVWLSEIDRSDLEILYKLEEDLKQKIYKIQDDTNSYKVIFTIIKKYESENFQEDIEISPKVWRLLKDNQEKANKTLTKLENQLAKVQETIKAKADIINSYIGRILIEEYKQPVVKSQYKDLNEFVLSQINRGLPYTRRITLG